MTSATRTNQTNGAIGIFDSGIGGLSTLHALRETMPEADLIYVADSAFLPYGNKNEVLIRERSEMITRFLIDQGTRIVVVACNTATAAAVPFLRDTFDVPIIGMEPAIKPAAAMTRSGVIGVLATENTVKSLRLASLTDRFARNIEVLTQPCHGLVELVEEYGPNTASGTLHLLEKYISPLLDAKADVLILGCTHYPFLKAAIQELAGPDVHILDTGPAIARHTLSQIRILNLDVGRHASETFYCTGNPERSTPLLQRLWKSDAAFRHVDLMAFKTSETAC